MSSDIVIRPADPQMVGERARADLRQLRDAVSGRFPEGSGPGVTGALADRPILLDGEVVVRPDVPARPLVLHEVMRLAAPLQLSVRCEAMGVDADPRHRVELEVHRTPSTARAAFTDHEVLGRPHGTLPWVTRPLLGSLVADLVREDDQLLMEAAPQRWFRITRVADGLELSVADGADLPVRRVMVASAGADTAVAAEIAWRWTVCEPGWQDCADWEDVPRDRVRLVG